MMKFTLEQIKEATNGDATAVGASLFEGVSTDSRNISRGQLFVPIKGEKYDGHDFVESALQNGAAGFVYEETTPHAGTLINMAKRYEATAIAVRDTLYALGELARSARGRFPGMPLVAITGSSGKSTTKEMAASILARTGKVLKNEGNLNNRVGLPITLFNLSGKIDVAVVELGTNEPGEIARLAQIADPQVACVTNVGPVHLEGLGSIEGVAREKGDLPRALDGEDIFVANTDDTKVAAMIDDTKSEVIAYGLKRPSSGIRRREFVSAKKIKIEADRSDFTLVFSAGEVEVRLCAPGMHNVINALAASAIALALDTEMEHIVGGLESHRQLKWRTQVHRLEGDVTVIEDCYNSNPLSALAAIDLLAHRASRTVAVLGEMRELGDRTAAEHERVGKYAATKGVDVLIALGEHAKYTKGGFESQKKKGPGPVRRGRGRGGENGRRGPEKKRSRAPQSLPERTTGARITHNYGAMD